MPVRFGGPEPPAELTVYRSSQRAACVGAGGYDAACNLLYGDPDRYMGPVAHIDGPEAELELSACAGDLDTGYWPPPAKAHRAPVSPMQNTSWGWMGTGRPASRAM